MSIGHEAEMKGKIYMGLPFSLAFFGLEYIQITPGTLVEGKNSGYPSQRRRSSFREKILIGRSEPIMGMTIDNPGEHMLAPHVDE
jgi:hypothetical protein